MNFFFFLYGNDTGQFSENGSKWQLVLNWVSDHGLGANKKACIPSQIALPQ
uniref:Uncharacterized protein n=1 Tax=Anguilla anguilla TaxID=7936 RepID=A0A0E9PN83_ANGAN